MMISDGKFTNLMHGVLGRNGHYRWKLQNKGNDYWIGRYDCYEGLVLLVYGWFDEAKLTLGDTIPGTNT